MYTYAAALAPHKRHDRIQPDITGYFNCLVSLGTHGATLAKRSGASAGFLERNRLLLRARREDRPALGERKWPSCPARSRRRQGTRIRLPKRVAKLANHAAGRRKSR